MGYNGGFGGGYGGYGGFGGCGGYQPCGYEEPRRCNSFALLVVLFILLIIIGSHFHKKC